ncbi:flagellar assembly protein FliH [Oleiagrimonas sp. C23AA]|uniref:flagellar assembly protein FliH n=1 Tax=Oleiagrimonas sp. C23AA TaxID=2719047 RepID=UPI00141DA95D|nr:flagellar assembly protein FliH [Oleiagrimonas sp. C23AA]NII09192.1 flagellar assembly protein FliH [Oleiagrimonas sp. C23AA]
MSERMGILAREELAQVRRWELPQVGSAEPAEPKEDPDAPRPPTVAELQALEDAAREEGYQRGLEEGREAARRERDAQAARLAQLFNAVARPLSDVDEATERDLAGLSALIAERVVRRQISEHPDFLIDIVREAISHLPAATASVRVIVHPDDAAMLRDALGEADERGWRIDEDKSLLPGDCRIVSDASRIDLRTETRLAAMIDALLGSDNDTQAGDDERQYEAGAESGA